MNIDHIRTQGQPWVGHCASRKAYNVQHNTFWGKSRSERGPWWSEWPLDKTPGRVWCPELVFKAFRRLGASKWWFIIEILCIYRQVAKQIKKDQKYFDPKNGASLKSFRIQKSIIWKNTDFYEKIRKSKNRSWKLTTWPEEAPNSYPLWRAYGTHPR